MKYTHVTNKLATEAVKKISDFTDLKEIIQKDSQATTLKITKYIIQSL